MNLSVLLLRDCSVLFCVCFPLRGRGHTSYLGMCRSLKFLIPQAPLRTLFAHPPSSDDSLASSSIYRSLISF